MTTAKYVELSCQTLFDLNAYPIVGGKLYAFDAGTTTARTLYQDAALTVPHPTPVLTNAYGRWPPMFADVGAYKIVTQDAAGAQIEVIDNLPGGAPDAGAAPTGTTIPTGHVMPAHRATAADGWLLLNGKSIGGPTSGATARASNDVQALYTLLWNEDGSLAVTGGRGANATSDFVAGKTLALPDYRGRTLAGLDGMGSSRANRLVASTGSPDTIGTGLGSETVTLMAGQMPSHNHGINIGAAGGHSHGGGISGVGDHQHSGTTGVAGNHSHTGQMQLGSPGGTSLAVPGSGTYQFTTNPAGDHQHDFTTSYAGGHSHGLTIDPVGDHSHGASSNNTGGDQAHANMPPTVLVSWLIKI